MGAFCSEQQASGPVVLKGKASGRKDGSSRSSVRSGRLRMAGSERPHGIRFSMSMTDLPLAWSRQCPQSAEHNTQHMFILPSSHPYRYVYFPFLCSLNMAISCHSQLPHTPSLLKPSISTHYIGDCPQMSGAE